MLGMRSRTSQGSGGLISLKLPDREVIEARHRTITLTLPLTLTLTHTNLRRHLHRRPHR